MASSTPQPRSPTDQPDVMNDPAFETNGKGKRRSTEENDTCRICRGEGSATEPLFYPCRCSGSIKFVHQECLMGWLSHSQKKHCELCKTPFRFTKLYHSDMPSKVPMLVFLKRASLHCLQSLMTVTRWLMVLTVWLGWVPWCMRIVWRGLFWIGDGGWITPQEIERRIALQEQPTTPALIGAAQATTPASPLSVAFGNVKWNPFKLAFGMRTEEPLILRIASHIYRIILYPVPKHAENITAGMSSHTSQRQGSLLSDYPLVSNFTRSATINNLAVDILEGQLIALLVVMGFILVFLIREWVVQQQPAINAGQAIEDANERAEAADEPQETEVEDVPQHVFESKPEDDGDIAVDATNSSAQHSENAEEPIAKPSLEGDVAKGDQVGEYTGAQSSFAMQRDGRNEASQPEAQPSTSGMMRPTLPHRGALTPASEIQRTLEEEALVSGHVWPGVDVFMDLWRRGESNPEEVLRIIQADGREDELAWIVSAMNRLQSGAPFSSKANSDFSSAIPLDSTEPRTGSPNSSWFLVDEGLEQNRSTEADANSTNAATNSGISRQQTSALDFAALHQARIERQREQSGFEAPLKEPSSQDNAPSAITDAHHHDQIALSHDDDVLPRNTLQSEQDVHLIDSLMEATAAITPADGHNEDKGTSSVEVPAQAPRNHSWADVIQEWLWGDIPEIVAVDDPGQDDHHIVQDVADEAPFVPVAEGQLLIDDGNVDDDPAPELDPEVLQAAADAGINPNEADIEDAEDLEGIMELIGAQGAIIGLFQNGMFCAVLIAIAFFAGVWIPYVTGKIVLVFLANPVPLLLKAPLRWTSAIADLIVDVVVFLAGWLFYAVDVIVKLTATPAGWIFPFIKHISQDHVLGNIALKYAVRSGNRLATSFAAGSDLFSDSDVPVFSIIAHESLIAAEEVVSSVASFVWHGLHSFTEVFASEATVVEKLLGLSHGLAKSTSAGSKFLVTVLTEATPTLFKSLRSFPYSISIDTPVRTQTLDYTLAYWSTQDRIIAVLIGYSFVFLLGAIYLKISTALRNGDNPKTSDFVDALNQAGGVTKVILIISIEMIVFPLYCGALLDIALLPLFGQATITSRLNFMAEAPLTSTFIHWFIGTCYMFHFALFVSMCRKLMRTGVLYFIRDPDDPSFHPVRDVLEKNVYTQLRKIAFSAVVYGALILICLGTVVWTISKTTVGILPIRWASSRPVLEYPVDLLVYNLVMPIAMTFFKPGTILTAVYNWWFRKCARWLRLTHFLFGEKREEEMWKFVRDPFQTLRLKDQTKPEDHLAEERTLQQAREIASFFPTGHFVRAPASDQVRLSKGSRTFVPVDEHGNRTDGVEDSDTGPHGRNNRMFKKIFIPHRFKLRISAFILLLWLFAAATGIACTIIPLLFGRMLFAHLLPPQFVVNDVYAFAMGAYLLGGPIYLAVRFRSWIEVAMQKLSATSRSFTALSNLPPILQQTAGIFLRGLRLLYFYAGLGLLFPLLLGLLWETYVIIPMLTFLHPLPAPPYTIRFVQSWTLAVIALKYAVKTALIQPETRPSRALRALVIPENRGAGWTDPDVRLATRAFVLPALVVVLAALAVPFGLAVVVLALVGVQDETGRAVVYRYAYPLMLSVGISVLAIRRLGRGLSAWREKVRDEVFLVGERLHNFGERSASNNTPATQAGNRTGHDVQRVDVRA